MSAFDYQTDDSHPHTHIQIDKTDESEWALIVSAAAAET